MDAETGERLGTRYIVEPWSHEGCDEYGDGQGDFKGVPHGRHELVETRAQAGCLAVEGLTPLIGRPVDRGIQYFHLEHQRA
ncbi:MAG: hypothetical protein QOF01_3166 [Thermomicrobiales bacterium]|nr:hypothetical protein [Thermomicrobiales bacterium]